MLVQSYQTTAYNYAHDSENKVHDDEIAARYGFEGGLVPGASDYAYLSHAVYAAWGDPWLHGGTMQAKFIKPIYHGEKVTAEARSEDGDEDRLQLALLNANGVVSAIGYAQRADAEPPPKVADYPRREPVDAGERVAPDPSALPPGYLLAAYEFEHDDGAVLSETKALFVDPLEGADGAPRWHPALCLHYANMLVRSNVALGPWIHTASKVHYLDAPRDGDRVSVRGRVVDTYVKRGHIVTDIDLAMFSAERALIKMFYTAIVRLAER